MVAIPCQEMITISAELILQIVQYWCDVSSKGDGCIAKLIRMGPTAFEFGLISSKGPVGNFTKIDAALEIEVRVLPRISCIYAGVARLRVSAELIFDAIDFDTRVVNSHAEHVAGFIVAGAIDVIDAEYNSHF